VSRPRPKRSMILVALVVVSCSGRQQGAVGGDVPPGTSESLATPSTTSLIGSTTAPATTVSVTASPSMPEVSFDGWPPAPSSFPALSGLPRLLPLPSPPSQAVELQDSLLTSGPADPPNGYTQTLVDVTSATLLTIVTAKDSPAWAGPASGTPLSVPGWQKASAEGGPTAYDLYLSQGGWTVRLRFMGVLPEEGRAIAIAASLNRRGAQEAGWGMSQGSDAESFEVVVEGWNLPEVHRTARWLAADGGPDIELRVGSRASPSITDLGSLAPLTVVTVAGRPAIAILREEVGTYLEWWPNGDTSVVLAARKSLEDALAIAESVTPVSSSEWDQSGLVLPPETEAGCDYFFNRC
jgi:hypothetical protein